MSILEKNVSDWKERDRIELLRQVKVQKEVMDYLKDCFKNFRISLYEYDFEQEFMDAMKRGMLIGWCWQTTESAIVFFKDEDYIERGALKFSTTRNYWHSWICFEFKNKIFVFDPCLQIIVEKEQYYHVFEISQIIRRVTAKSVKDDLVDKIQNKGWELIKENGEFVLKLIASKNSLNEEYETKIWGNNNANSPMYLNNTGYVATIENNRIIKLIAFYYHS